MGTLVRVVPAVSGLLVSVAGFVVFAAIGGGVWWVRAEAGRRADALAARADTAIAAADHAVGFVREVIAQAQEDLTRARATAVAVAPEPVHPFVQFGARRASQELVGSVDRANAAVVAASDAVVVANTAFELFDKDERLQGWFGVRAEQLERTRTDLGAATRELKKARTVLGVPVAPGATPTADQLNSIESGLAGAQDFTEHMGSVVASTRARVAETRRRVDVWALRAALVTTAFGALGAAGQLFTARFCWRVLRGKPA